MLKITEVDISTSRYKFRQLSRDVSGHCFDIPEGNNIFFAIYTAHKLQLHVGCITFSLADLKEETCPEHTFESEYFHHITFMFIKRDYQDRGYGKELIKKVFEKMAAHDFYRPVHVQSAVRAVGFFEKMGFVRVGQPLDTLGCG